MVEPTPSDRFHNHLDICKRCREQPFNLCSVGFELLKTAANPNSWKPDVARND